MAKNVYNAQLARSGIFVSSSAVSYTHLDVYKRQGLCDCSDNYPLLAGGICRQCPNSSYYYDIQLSRCALCPNGMSVSLDNNTCMCFSNQIYVNHSCSCPADKPYLAR